MDYMMQQNLKQGRVGYLRCARSIEQFVDRYYRPPTSVYPYEDIFRKEMLKICKKQFKETGKCVIPAEACWEDQNVQYQNNFSFLYDWVFRKLNQFCQRNDARAEIQAQFDLIGFVDTHHWEKVKNCGVCGRKFGKDKTSQLYQCKDCGVIFRHDFSESFKKSMVKEIFVILDTCEENQKEQKNDSRRRKVTQCYSCISKDLDQSKIKHTEKLKNENFRQRISRALKEKLLAIKWWARIFLT